MKKRIAGDNEKVASKAKAIELIYEAWAPFYDHIFGKLLFNEGREQAIDLLGLKKGSRVLEVGVGTGLTLPLYPADSEVIGVDLSVNMLEKAEELLRKRRLRHCSVKRMDATALQFPEGFFDAVLGNLFISATSFPRESLLEMKRVCKKGGTIVLMNHFHSEKRVLGALETAFNPVARALGFHSNLKMAPLLESVGLEAAEVRKVNAFNLWSAVRMVNTK